MPKCNICGEFVAPDFMFLIDERMDLQCAFCMIGKEEITVDKDSHGKPRIYSKKQAVEDYRILLKMLKDNPKIAKSLIDKGVESLKKGE